MRQIKLIRITTVPISLKTLLKGQHRFMSQNGFEVIGVSSEGQDLQDVKKEEGIQVVALEMTRTIAPLLDLVSLWFFYRLCKKEKPLMVHSHTPKAGIVGMLGAKLAGVPIRLHTVAGLPLLEVRGSKRKLLNFVEKISYACATKIYPNSFGLRDIIIQEQFCKTEKLKVIGTGSSNGINTSYFNPLLFSNDQKQALKSNLGVTVDDYVFVFVGRLVGDKGINELIQAFQKISSEISNIKLLLVGPLEAELDPLEKETIEEINSNKNIISVGFQKDVRAYFSISDCLAFPSYREGFPNVVMQAGAMGLPSIVTNINGCNEIIVEGENGTIIPVKDKVSLYKAMRKMIEDNSFREQVQQNARPMIVSRYEQKVVWEAILSEYKSLEKNV